MTRHFKSKTSYKKWKAFIHIHKIKTHKDKYVYIKGKKHYIKH